VDHINLRGTDVARSARFYNSLFGGPILRVASIPANPTSPAGEAFYIQTGDSYLVVSPAFEPDKPGLDHICFGVNDYAAEPVATRLRMAGIMTLAANRPGADVDVWARDAGGIFVQLRSPGGWARLSTNRGGIPAEGFAGSGAFSVVSVKRIGLQSTNAGRSGDFYGRLFGTELRARGSAQTRDFAIGGSVLSIAQSPLPGQDDVLDFIEFGVKAFSPNVVRQTLRERGILAESVGGRQLHINDPDGIAVRLSF